MSKIILTVEVDEKDLLEQIEKIIEDIKDNAYQEGYDRGFKDGKGE